MIVPGADVGGIGDRHSRAALFIRAFDLPAGKLPNHEERSLTHLLEGKVAVITGAAGGIGRASALTFAREGAKVVLADRAESELSETARQVSEAGGDAVIIPTDVTRREDVVALVALALERHGRLDCAFNNAGIPGGMAPFAELDDAQFHEIMDINVHGAWMCTQEEIKAMLPTGGGSIVNASSGLGLIAAPQVAAYVTSKHAVLGLTRAAALDYPRQGIRVNAVLPGVVDTAMPQEMFAASPEVLDAIGEHSPMGRLARPEEVAEAAAWLCSDRASYVNGHGLVVDGGIVVS
jgi:A-factor type gamma-butyrolactone 1'-reductase (1S-forming)